jgi:hypothetical protein
MVKVPPQSAKQALLLAPKQSNQIDCSYGERVESCQTLTMWNIWLGTARQEGCGDRIGGAATKKLRLKPVSKTNRLQEMGL